MCRECGRPVISIGFDGCFVHTRTILRAGLQLWHSLLVVFSFFFSAEAPIDGPVGGFVEANRGTLSPPLRVDM